MYNKKETKAERAYLVELVRAQWPYTTLQELPQTALTGRSWYGRFRSRHEYILECGIAYSKAGTVKEVSIFWVDGKRGVKIQLRRPEIRSLIKELLLNLSK